MSTTKDLLEKLDGKVSNLLAELKEAKEQFAKKNQEIESLKTKLQEGGAAFDKLSIENKTLKKALAESVETKVENTDNQEELKFKISEMVKEIDRCISLLKV